MATARRALREIENLKRVGDEFRSEDTGTLAIATTHTQARYVLPPVLRDFADALSQGQGRAAPGQSAAGRRADRRAARPTSASRPRRSPTFPSWSRCPATSGTAACSCRAAIRWPRSQPLTLEALARYPIVTYDFAFTGRSQINAAFDAAGPRAERRADRARRRRDQDLRRAGHGRRHRCADGVRPSARRRRSSGSTPRTCSRQATTRLALRRDVFLRGYVYEFIALFAPALDRAAVDAALAGRPPPAPT